MRERNFIGIRITALLLLGITTACGASGSSGSDQPQDPIVQSVLARNTNPQASDADLAAVTAGNTAFALKVLPLLDPDGGSNTVFSPFSITQAFALAAPGAVGTTLSGIEQALSFPFAQERFAAAWNKLDLLLTSETAGAVTADGEQLPQLRSANSIWGQTGFPILPGYLDTLAVNYGAGLRLVDFIQATEAARGTINAWVQGQTNNRIQNLIPQGGVTSDTRVVLTNAVWFKANWASQFQEANTTNQPFINRSGPASSVPFMRQTFAAPYAEAPGWRAVDLPYTGGKLSMLVIMPDPGTFDAFLSSLTPTVLADIANRLASRQIALSLPKFTFTKEADLKPILRTLGMIDAFLPGVADFSGIDGKRDLFISDVFHKAFIAVDEHGTEAAAATAIVAGITSAPLSPLPFTIDHPYLFLIRERQTGLILFMGKVVSL